LRASITTPGRATLSNYLSSASELYQELLEPVAGLLAGKKRLVIVPDGALYYLPFEVLLQKGGIEIADVPLSELPYLVRSFSVSYAPSVSVLEMLGRPAEQGAGTQSPPDDFIAFADPDYGNPDNGAEGGDEGGLGSLSSVVRGTFGFGGLWKLDRLPGSRIEVEQIAGLFPQGRSSLFLGAEATEENVKSPGRLGRYRYIHFAVHGLIDESQPQFTSLVLSPPSYEAGHWADKSGPLVREDGLLQAYEIFNLRLRADLVTLSACETGLGKQVKGEGLIGLSRAFFYAGAPSLLVSLWKVDDRSTASLMTSFYSRLRASAFGKPNDASKDGENGLVDSASKAGALREAKLKLIASGNFSHPYYWAPFILSGKP
ncbi:MAG TPA: CHAT domain-containing protein, partial [Blastocatellia bacterium]|nr:CHAT domain-containing protein [Blastocatellia bacterium]